MDCREFRSKIPDFVNGTIEPSCLDEFLNHAKNCSDCMDEMEINYMINTGLEKIEDNDRDSYNIKEDLQKQLKKKKKKADEYFRIKLAKKGLFVLSEMVAVIMAIIEIVRLFFFY